MSYILDALRRADAERERGRVPTLHAQPALADAAGDARPKPPARRWPWAGAGGLALLLLGAAASHWWSQQAPDRAPAPQALSGAPQPQTPPPVVLESPRPPPLPAPPAPARVVPAVPSAMPSVAPSAVQSVVPSAVPSQAPRPPAQSAEAAVPALRELPEALRRELPPLAASGAMYSETAANRLLIINGQLFHEGDTVAPQVVLQQIRLRSAVLSFKGQRFRLDY